VLLSPLSSLFSLSLTLCVNPWQMLPCRQSLHRDISFTTLRKRKVVSMLCGEERRREREKEKEREKF
jgi:hypothetical protein